MFSVTAQRIMMRQLAQCGSVELAAGMGSDDTMRFGPSRLVLFMARDQRRPGFIKNAGLWRIRTPQPPSDRPSRIRGAAER